MKLTEALATPRRLLRTAMPSTPPPPPPILGSVMMASLLRRSPLLLLAALLVALAVFVLADGAPPAAQAQNTPTVLVSNIEQTAGADDEWPTTLLRAQGFTTGSHAAGYTLTSIEWKINLDSPLTAAQIARLRVELWSATTAGLPDASIVSLTAPSTVASGDVAFTAPANTTLAADTTYFAYFFKSPAAADIGDLELVTTTSNSEDSGGAAGWSIGDVAHFNAFTTWGPIGGGAAHNIRVNGFAGQAAAPLDLSALTAESSTDGSAFSAMTGAEALAPAFDADTTGYRATVGSDVTHVRLTPTLADATSSVKVGKAGTTLSPVTSGTASDPIALVVGDNAITVEVTAADSSTQDYTVTVRRVPTGSEWWATLTVQDMGSGVGLGCYNDSAQASDRCRETSVLTEDAFTVSADDFDARWIATNASGSLILFELQGTATAALKALNLCVGSREFSLSGMSSGSLPRLQISNLNPTLSWSAGDTVSLSIGTSCAQATQSTNANLSNLTASSSTSAGGAFTALILSPAFDAGTTSYSATVGNDITHVKLTPTLADSGATVRVGGSPVTSGTASAAIALDVGDNAIIARVTAEDGTTQKDYTVTITREAQATLSSNANLSSLTASGGTSAGGTFTAFDLTPAFDAGTTSYSATVANSITHVKLTPTVADSGASVTVGGDPVTSGTASAAQAVEVGSNNIFAVVNAEDDATVKNYLVVITRQGQAATATVSLSASPSTVDEGSSVTITATLSAAQTSAVTIPLTITDNTTDSGDHGTLASITISANSATGTGTISTTQDTDDESDETFTVSLGSLPSGITAGTPSSVQITIRDDDTTTTPTPTPSTPSTTPVKVCWDDDANGDFPESDCGPANRASYGYRILIGSAADGDADSPAIYVKVTPTLLAGATVRVGTVTLDSNGNITGFVSGNSHSVTSGEQSGPIKLDDGQDYDGDGSISEDERKADRVNTIIGLQFNDSEGVQRTYTLSVQRNVGGL